SKTVTGTCSVGSRTSPSGKSPISSIREAYASASGLQEQDRDCEEETDDCEQTHARTVGALRQETLSDSSGKRQELPTSNCAVSHTAAGAVRIRRRPWRAASRSSSSGEWTYDRNRLRSRAKK